MELELESWDTTLRGLHQYARSVAAALGLKGDSYCAQPDPLETYLALDGFIPGFPQRDVALLWDEQHGWAGAIETACSEDLIVLSYLGEDVLPAPERVARYARALLDGAAPGHAVPPTFPAAVRRLLPQRLAQYAATSPVPGLVIGA
ncbi:DUF6292 family protein [Saccharomonospora sp. NPDC046836]|uniref:DUF6292 family protein n=1 Tax=Saccharomonospora sp. NPDC046836 TaxID=3156921 RepID=UPI0033C0C6A2